MGVASKFRVRNSYNPTILKILDPPLHTHIHTHTHTHFNPAPSGSPGKLSVSHKLPTTAELFWSPVPIEMQNGIITRYTVEVVGPGSSRDIFVLDADTTYIKIPGLRLFTSYTFNVSAMTKAGTGPAAIISSKTPEGGEMLIFCIII